MRIGMDCVTNICKYYFLCFVTIIQVKAISGHQVKRSNKKNRDLELRHMFLGQIFAKNVGDERGATQRHVRSVRDLYSECVYRAIVRQLASPLRVSGRSRVAQWTPDWSGGAGTGVGAACNNRSAVSVLFSPDKEKGSSPTRTQKMTQDTF